VITVPRKRKIETVVYVENGELILFGKNLLGPHKGLINGFGGGVKPGETIETATKREVWEETKDENGNGIVIRSMYNCGVIQKYKNGKRGTKLYFFWVIEFEGEAHKTIEMLPKWYYKNNIPSENERMQSDKFLFSPMLAGKKVVGDIYYNKTGKIIYVNIKIIEKTPHIINF